MSGDESRMWKRRTIKSGEDIFRGRRISADRSRHIPLFLQDARSNQNSSSSEIMEYPFFEVDDSTIEQLVPNRGRLGYYRVMYDQKGYLWMREQFITRSSRLSGTDRAGFLYDMTAFAKAQLYYTVAVLDVLQYVPGESDVSVWGAATTFLLELASLLWEQGKEVQRDLMELARSVIEETYAIVGLVSREDESAIEGKLRQTILPLAGRAGIPSFVKDSMGIVRALGDDNGDSVPNLPETAMAEVMATVSREPSFEKLVRY